MPFKSLSPWTRTAALLRLLLRVLVLADRLHCLTENDVSVVSLNTVKAPVFAFCFTGCCISRNICFQASRSRFPTSYFQTGNQGLECAQNTKSLTWVSGWKKDAGDLHLVVIWKPGSRGDLKISTFCRSEYLLPMGTSFLWRPSDPHPVASWRPPSYADLKSSILRVPEHLHWRPLHYGAPMISALWSFEDLHSMEPWRPLLYGALETSTLWSPEDLHFMEPWRPPLYGALKTSTLWSPEDL